MKIKRVHILGIPVDIVNMNSALDFVSYAVNNRTSPGTILAVNPEKVFLLKHDATLKSFFEKAELLIPDGIGIIKALKILYSIKVSRCPGVDLMINICKRSSQENYRLFIYGASEYVNATACSKLREQYPGIQIVGRSNGFVKPEEMSSLVSRINDSNANILFIAMGSPRQEKWMINYLPQLKTIKLCQGIGGTLDTIVGTVKRAPAFWQNNNLEWFYRLLCQPSRAKRQVNCFKFALLVFLQKIKKR